MKSNDAFLLVMVDHNLFGNRVETHIASMWLTSVLSGTSMPPR